MITTATRGLTFLMPETGGIITSTFTSDSGGGATASRGTVSTPCRIDALAGNESEVANRISDRSTHIVSFPAETTVTVENDLAIGSVTYEITAVRDYSGELTRVVEVVAR